MDSPRAHLLGVVLLVGALVAAYANSFRVPFLFDDAESIANNPTIHRLASSWMPPAGRGITTSGRPLLNVSFAINYAIHGETVFGYHVANLLIHTLAALVLWGVIRRTLLQPVFAGRFTSLASPLAWCAAALWALHPLQTESVTYIVQRAESLVGLFYLLTLYGFIRSVEARPAGNPNRCWPAFTVIACLAGMAAKEVMASAPLIIFFYDRTFISGTVAASWRRHRRLHLSLAATWLMLLACIVQSGGRGGSVGFAQVGWWEYALTQAPAILGYVWRAFWPANLIFDYGAVVEKNFAIIVPAGAVILLGLAAGAWALRQRPVAGFSFAWFFLILAPTSSLVPVATQTVAEHRMYLPLAALVVPAVLLLSRFAGRATFPICIALLVAAGIRTQVRNHDYRDELTIWGDTARRLPDNPRARNNHGAMLFDAGRLDEAIGEFRAAIDYTPDYAEAWHNLGRAYTRVRRFDEAIAALRRAVELNASPTKAIFQGTLGNALLEAGRPDEAIATYRHALELSPHEAIHSYNLANTLMQAGQMEESGRLFDRARALDPHDPEILGAYAVWLRRSGRAQESVALLQEALRLQPDSARLHSHLGVSLLAAGRATEGIRELEIALPLNPALPQTRYHLGLAYAENGLPADAIPHFEEMLRLSPPTAELFDNLGTLYAQTGRYADAVTAFQKALALDPTHRNARDNLQAVRNLLRGQAR
ncbi:tetratricopeptide repeat protein [Oleiharenicola lentus]|uniref:tetratricopeptide repeat protein n=1 Tax=Oleiharenicola lentus TaxID=2508720 RepID=UPI003F67B86F